MFYRRDAACHSLMGATLPGQAQEGALPMPTITYVEPNGMLHSIEVPVGLSVMQGAVNHSIAGIVAECGGACACATCHVYVDPGWLEASRP